ncbi:MAG: hypothetical protein Kow0090_00420 [Myxococcota bacterium]
MDKNYGAFLIPVIFLILLFIKSAYAAFDWGSVENCVPQFVRVTFADPDASTKMGVGWNTKTDCPTVVEYGKTTAYGNTADGASQKANGVLNWVHDVMLEDLAPGTTYHYRVGDGTTFSKDYSFVTAPPESNLCPEFSFAIAGDSRADTDGVGPSDKWDDIVTEALNESSAVFVLNGGDLVKNGSDDKEWLNYLAGTPQELMALYPILPAMGNHDKGPGKGEGANYNQIFFLPRNSVTNTEDYYHFRYGTLLMVALDTQNYTDFAAQSRWIDEIMAQNGDAVWKIAFFHHPVYTSAGVDVFGLEVGHPPNENGQNEFYVKAFDKYHFDFAIAAHNHYYERFKPSFGGYGKEPQPVDDPEKGTIYMVSGGGGAITFQEIGVNAICGFMAAPGSVSCGGKHHYVKFHIKGYTLKMETWETSQQVTGKSPSFHKKIDELTITKPFDGVDPCTLPQDPDNDGDGYPASSDCRDDLKEVNPGAEEICDDGMDNNCNELIDKADPACFVIGDDDDDVVSEDTGDDDVSEDDISSDDDAAEEDTQEDDDEDVPDDKDATVETDIPGDEEAGGDKTDVVGTGSDEGASEDHSDEDASVGGTNAGAVKESDSSTVEGESGCSCRMLRVF